MNKRAAIILSILAMAVFGALPWIWEWSHLAAVACVIAIATWSIWLMVLYLQWARRLGHEETDNANGATRGRT